MSKHVWLASGKVPTPQPRGHKFKSPGNFRVKKIIVIKIGTSLRLNCFILYSFSKSPAQL